MTRIIQTPLLPASLMLLPLLAVTGCAKIGSPTGGAKDVTPPKYVSGEPENRSTRFSEKEITFSFDEYIQFKDLNKELLISPPMEKKPDVQVRDRSVRIKLKSELLPDATYTLSFGNAITDLNESNPVRDFEFVFSTGDRIDSLSLTGKALNAFDHKPLKDAQILVMLYDRFGDSIPMKEIPRFVGRANKDGLFTVNNLGTDTFRVIAVNDLNNNLKYDRGDEEVAFLDSLTVISAQTVKPVHFIKDTVKAALPEKAEKETRSGKKPAVKQMVDTTVVQGKNLNAVNVSLYYFSELTEKVYLESRKREIPEKLQFIFNRPPVESVKLERTGAAGTQPWFMEEHGVTGDTLTYWITDTLVSKSDTLQVMLTYATTDSAGRAISRTDTLQMRYQEVQEKNASGRKSRATLLKKAGKFLMVTPATADKGTQNLNASFAFTAGKPLEATDPSKMELYVIRDTLETPARFMVVADSVNRRRFALKVNWVENTNYRLVLWPGAVHDIYGAANDTLQVRFLTQKADFYGRILLTAAAKQYPVIVELYNEKGNLAGWRRITEPGKQVFDFLPPARYTVKAIADRNDNGTWDTGDYLRHLQPEPVYFYTLPVVLRSNWDYEINWDIPD